jgi:hypothetical protein
LAVPGDKCLGVRDVRASIDVEEHLGGPTGQGSQLGWLTTASPRALVLLSINVALLGGGAVGLASAEKPLLALAVVALVVVGLLVALHLEAGALVLVTFVPILSGLRRGFPVPYLRITELLTIGIGGIVLLTLRRVKSRPWTRVEWLLLVYVVAYAGFGLYDNRQLGGGLNFTALGTLIGPLQFFLLYRTVRLALPGPKSQAKALRFFLLASVPVSILALMQQVNVPGIRSFIVLITDSATLSDATGSGYATFARATGPFDHWTPLAGYLLVVLILGTAILLEPFEFGMTRLLLVSVLLLDLIALVATAELSAIFGIIVAAAMLARWTGRSGQVVRWAGLVVIVLGVFGGTFIAHRLQAEFQKTAGTNQKSQLPQTISFRLNIWDHQYIPAIGLRPLSGYGVIQPDTISWPDTESMYITLLMRGGIPLLVVYGGLMVAMATTGSKVAAVRGSPSQRAMGLSLKALVVVLVPLSVVFPYFDDGGLPQAMCAMMGIMMAAIPGRLPATGLVEVSLQEKRVRGMPTA